MSTVSLHLRLTLLLAFCLLFGGCVTGSHDEPQQRGTIDTVDQARFDEAMFTALCQQSGGIYTLDASLGNYVSSVGMMLARVSERPGLGWEFAVLNRSAPGLWALPGGKVALSRSLLALLDDEAELAAVLAVAVGEVAGNAEPAPAPISLAAIGTIQRKSASWDTITLRATHTDTDTRAAASSRVMRALDDATIGRLARAGYDPHAFAGLLRRIPAAEADWEGGLPLLQTITEERVDAIGRSADRLGGGDRGAARFLSRTTRLRHDQAAYAAYERGVVELDAGRSREALGAAEEALSLQPREALFHELRGIAAARADMPAAAFSGLNRAIAMNSGFFRPYLLRGLLHLQRGNLDLAHDDLRAANRLLPTEEATLGLAEAARGLGDIATARRLYARVGNGTSKAARFARTRIAQMADGALSH